MIHIAHVTRSDACFIIDCSDDSEAKAIEIHSSESNQPLESERTASLQVAENAQVAPAAPVHIPSPAQRLGTPGSRVLALSLGKHSPGYHL